MKEWFSGFDMLDAQEYDEVMEIMAEDDTAAMMDELATAQAEDYFNNELGRDATMKKDRYQVITAYGDFSSSLESTNDIQQALGAAQIRVSDPSVLFISIYDEELKRDIFHWECE